ncbi:beta-1,3-glucanase family protein [Longimicrobium sp.]|uniref:beta-1,3-glucanase family protein n=1 Tax=Longimicrobium sp. TaxID=2029185 RepID=UPI003B3A79D7
MFTITINVPQDVLKDGGPVQAAMYGRLLAPYTPTAGASAGTALPVGQWVCFTGQDYAAASGTVPPFATYTAAGAQTLNLPDVAIQAAHVVFGIGTLPAIPVIGGQPQEPSPLSTPGIYDFVELTYGVDGVLYLNTTMIDQFGIPIQIQVQPAEAALPAGAGVTMPRAQVLGTFAGYVAGNGFLQCAQDPFGKPLATRILSPANALVANAPQGVVAGAFDGPPSTLAAGTYYYVVTALDGTGAGAAESYAQATVARATVTAGQAVQVA